jgi:hypothetical protein
MNEFFTKIFNMFNKKSKSLFEVLNKKYLLLNLIGGINYQCFYRQLGYTINP